MRSAKLKFEKRRARIRKKISSTTDRVRLSIFKSNKHIYVQIIGVVDGESKTLVSASTLDKKIRKLKKSNCNIDKATQVGELISEKAIAQGIEGVVFDRGGYKYHGVVKAFADSARKRLRF